MGEMADLYNQYQEDTLEEISDYLEGRISKLDAVEKGILQEDGSLFPGTPNPPPQDFNSLVEELNILSLLMRRN